MLCVLSDEDQSSYALQSSTVRRHFSIGVCMVCAFNAVHSRFRQIHAAISVGDDLKRKLPKGNDFKLPLHNIALSNLARASRTECNRPPWARSQWCIVCIVTRTEEIMHLIVACAFFQ